MPPDAHELRAELNILPLMYDSEGCLLLPPKEIRQSRNSQEKSIRQLLGRSPDRADSLAQAIWVMARSKAAREFSNRILAYDDDRGRFEEFSR